MKADPQDQPVPLEMPDDLEFQVCQDQKDTGELLEDQVHVVWQVKPETRAMLDLPDHQVVPDPLDQPDNQEIVDVMVPPDHPV